MLCSPPLIAGRFLTIFIIHPKSRNWNIHGLTPDTAVILSREGKKRIPISPECQPAFLVQALPPVETSPRCPTTKQFLEWTGHLSIVISLKARIKNPNACKIFGLCLDIRRICQAVKCPNILPWRSSGTSRTRPHQGQRPSHDAPQLNPSLLRTHVCWPAAHHQGCL